MGVTARAIELVARRAHVLLHVTAAHAVTDCSDRQAPQAPTARDRNVAARCR